MRRRLCLRLLIVAVSAGLLYALLLTALSDALEASMTMPRFDQRGPFTVFIFFSGLLGWVLYHVASREIDTVGPLTSFLVFMFSGLAIGLGSALFANLNQTPFNALQEISGACFVLAGLTGTCMSIVKDS